MATPIWREAESCLEFARPTLRSRIYPPLYNCWVASSQAAADLGMAYSARANQESAKTDGDNQQIANDLQAAIDSMSGFLAGRSIRPKKEAVGKLRSNRYDTRERAAVSCRRR